MAQFPNTTTADGIWTLKKIRRAILGNNWPEAVIADEFFANTTLLLQGDTSNEAMLYNAFGDASTNAHDITPVGGVHGTPFSPYNESWSVDFDGTTDYLSAASDTSFDCGTGNFTLEAWVYIRSENNAYPIICGNANPSYTTAGSLAFGNHNTDNASNNNKFIITARDNNNFRFVDSTTHPLNTWIHIAVVRDSSTTLKMFRDGVETASTTIPSTMTFNWGLNGFRVGGGNWDGANRSEIDGYISNLRLVKGTAVYTTDFTPSTEPLTAISGTSVLTCQSNRFVDNSSNDHTITVTGNSAIRGFSPFADTDTVTGSGYFDGSGDYLSIANDASLNVGTGEFTIECWFYLNTIITDNVIISNYENANDGYVLRVESGVVKANLSGNAFDIAGTTTVQANTWNHIALSGSSGSIKLFLNGTQEGSTYTGAISMDSTAATTLNSTASNAINGYISNARIVKGTALYTSNFTPPTSPLTAVSGTSLLTLQNRGANRNIGFIDSSHPTRQITRNGNVTQGSFSPFSQDEGKWGNYFDGSGDTLKSPTSADFAFGTGDFTVEFWLLYKGGNGYKFFWNLNPTPVYIGYGLQDGTLTPWLWQDADVAVGNTNITPNVWQHHAVVRENGVIKIYLDGIEIASAPYTTNISTNKLICIGGNGVNNTQDTNGIYSNFRVVKGTALYTSAFTPPIEPLTAITNTSLLTCQSNRFVDNSSNAHSITVNGDTEVTPFSPFAPSTAYDPATKGGSGYFDGSGDYLVVSDGDSDAVLGSGDFTVELWVNASTIASGTRDFLGIYDGDPNSLIIGQVAGNVRFWCRAVQITSSSTISAGTWHHIAAVKSGSTGTLYIDGVSEGTATISTPSDTNFSIGRSGIFNGNYFNGSMSDLRITKGEAVYTSAFTPPTAPLTKTDSTSLLLNFTNAGIYDGTGRNVLETVGDAHVENSVKKYGTGSMQFDGTGDYLEAPNSDLFDISSGDFTIEAWIYPTSVSGTQAICAVYNFSSNRRSYIFYLEDDHIAFIYTTDGQSATIVETIGTISISTNEWTHVAVAKSGTSFKSFVNGVEDFSITVSSSFYSNTSDPFTVGVLGATGTLAEYFNGYIDDLRITKGVARYTANFTPPAAVLPKQ